MSLHRYRRYLCQFYSLSVLLVFRRASSDSSDDSGSDSDEGDAEESTLAASRHAQVHDTALDDDEEGGPGTIVSPEQVRTKNEVAELNITIPDIQEVGEEEVLENVGEIISIIDKVAIVKGVPSQVVNRASDRALDSDTLLVFEDRKVLGYVSGISSFA